MLKQIGFLPAGIQSENNTICSVSDDYKYMIYCSTLAAYVIDINNFETKSICSGHQHTITSVTWGPNVHNFITTGLDGKVIKWDAETGNELLHLTFSPKSYPYSVCWNDPLYIYFLQKPGFIMVWNQTTGKSTEMNKSPTYSATAIAITKSSPFTLIYGCKDGKIGLVHLQTKNNINNNTNIDSKVTNIYIEPVEQKYVLVLFENNNCILLDIDTLNLFMKFDVLRNRVSCLLWQPYTAGNFFLFSRTSPSIFCYHISSANHQSTIKLGIIINYYNISDSDKITGGISNAIYIPNTNKASWSKSGYIFFGGLDGWVAYYDISSNSILWSLPPSHCETVFDCKINCRGNILATGSFDKTVKLYSLSNPIKSLSYITDIDPLDQEGFIYAIAWGPDGAYQNHLATATSGGQVCLWETSPVKRLHKLSIHKNGVVGLSWSHSYPYYIATASFDNSCCIIAVEGQLIDRILLPDQAIGVEFHPNNGSLVLIGSRDGIIRLYDISNLKNNSNNIQKKFSSKTISPIATFNGHTAKVFHVVWNPYLENIFCSGSDDKTIRVWNKDKMDSLMILEGHTLHVRALCWCLALPRLLISGSWDHTLRVWDSVSGECLSVIYDHTADIYGLATHISLPFIFYSSSRDNSLRVWSIDIYPPLLKIICQGFLTPIPNSSYPGLPNLPSSFIASPNNIFYQGDCKDKLNDSICQFLSCTNSSTSPISPNSTTFSSISLSKIRNFCTFFLHRPGLQNLFQLISTIIAINPNIDSEKRGSISLNSIPFSKDSIVHTSQLENITLTNAQILSVPSTVLLERVKYKERLEQAAVKYIQLGMFRDYCEIQIKLENFERAIAIAPTVSLEYWKELCEKYILHLQNNSSLSTIAPFLAINNSNYNLLSHFKSLRDYNSAICTASTLINGGYKFNTNDINSEVKTNTTPQKDKIILSELIDEISTIYFNLSFPVIAACYYLSISDVSNAIFKLIYGNELLIAFSVASCLSEMITPSDYDHVFLLLSILCEKHNLYKEALVCLKNVSNLPLQKNFLCGRFVNKIKNQQKIDDFFIIAGLRTQTSILSAAKEAEQSHDDSSAIELYITAGNIENAAKIALPILFNKLSSNDWSFNTIYQIFFPLTSLDLDTISSKSLKDEILAYSHYFALLQAIWNNYYHIVNKLEENFFNLIARSNIDFPIPLALIELQCIIYISHFHPDKALTRIHTFLSTRNDLPVNIKQAAAGYQETISKTPKELILPIPQPIYIPSSSKFPSASYCPSCFISNEKIEGTYITLEDNKTTISQTMGLTWYQVNPFSPLMTGKRFNPY